VGDGGSGPKQQAVKEFHKGKYRIYEEKIPEIFGNHLLRIEYRGEVKPDKQNYWQCLLDVLQEYRKGRDYRSEPDCHKKKEDEKKGCEDKLPAYLPNQTEIEGKNQEAAAVYDKTSQYADGWKKLYGKPDLCYEVAILVKNS